MLTQGRPRAASCTRFAFLAVVVAGLSLIAGCAARRAEPPERPAAEAPKALAIPAGATLFDVDPVRTSIVIRVYRAGPLARFGHDHVITARGVSGIVWRGSDPADSGFELRIPVQSLVVDDPAARAAAGPGFASHVPESARAGTYQNLLRPEVLDASRFPEIVVRSSGLGGTWGQPVAIAEATLKGRSHRIDVPLAISRAGTLLTARGAVRIRQTDFGMTPFSVAGGAIEVADDVDVGFEIAATAR